MSSANGHESEEPAEGPVSVDERSARFKMPWFLSKTAVISGSAFIVAALVAAIVMPSMLDAEADPPVAEEPAQSPSDGGIVEDYRAAQEALAIAQCEAEETSIAAGTLMQHLGSTLDGADVIGTDEALIGENERLNLANALQQVALQFDEAPFTAEQQQLVEGADDRTPCDQLELDDAAAATGEAPTREDVEALEDQADSVESIGVEMAEVTGLVDSLADPVQAAVQSMQPDSYVTALYWRADPEVLNALPGATEEMSQSLNEQNGGAESTLDLLDSLVVKTTAVSDVVASHYANYENTEQDQPGVPDPTNPVNPPPAPR